MIDFIIELIIQIVIQIITEFVAFLLMDRAERMGCLWAIVILIAILLVICGLWVVFSG